MGAIFTLAGTRKVRSLNTAGDALSAGLSGVAADAVDASGLVILIPVPEAQDAAQYVVVGRADDSAAVRSGAVEPVSIVVSKAKEQARAPKGFDLYEATIAAPAVPGFYVVRLADKAFRFRVAQPVE